MKTRYVGSTGLSISEIGFGCGGNAGLMVRGDANEQTKVIAHALDRGITYFDNAPDYGNGAAEENLGRALRELEARPVINTKVEIRAENLGDIASHIVRSLEGSLRRLKVDAVDIMQIHNGPVTGRPAMQGAYYSTLWLDDFLKEDGVLEGVRRVLDSGKARYSGFICRGNDAEEVGTLLRTGLFHLVNVPYTLLNPTAGTFKLGKMPSRDYGNVIGAAEAAGAGIAVFSPLAGGLLTDTLLAGQQTHPLARHKDIEGLAANGELRQARKLQKLAEHQNMSLSELAYRFILRNHGVSTLLGGFSSIEQVDAAVSASAAGHITDATLAAIEHVWRG
jgi:L-glyceraldehyde 3-phosphate reductase